MDIVRATPSHLPFLRQMLYEAAFWRQDHERPPLDAALAQPDLAVYLDGWGRAGDIGLLAVVDGNLAGAVWVRSFDEHAHGYGYLDEHTPELTIAVLPDHRRQGIATTLLAHLLEAPRLGAARVSLSVEPDNPALTLYRRSGFVEVDASDGSLTMVRALGGASR